MLLVVSGRKLPVSDGSVGHLHADVDREAGEGDVGDKVHSSLSSFCCQALKEHILHQLRRLCHLRHHHRSLRATQLNQPS